jgi:hypothetical protein
MLNQETETPKSNGNDNKIKQIEEPIVLGSSNDLLLKQAMNHFKGITAPINKSAKVNN